MILAAIAAVTVLAIKEPAPDCRPIAPTWHTESGMFEGRAIGSAKRARVKVQKAAARAGADTIHVRRIYRIDPGGTRVVLADAYLCGSEVGREGGE